MHSLQPHSRFSWARVASAAAVLVVALQMATSPASAGLELTLDAESLTRILTIVAPPQVAVGMAPGPNIEVKLEEMQVTGFEPSGPGGTGGLGRLLTKMRVRAPEIGLDVRVQPKVALEIRKQDGLSFAFLRFEQVQIPMPWGTLDAGPLLPSVPVQADHVFEIVGDNGTSGLRARLVEAKMTSTALRLTFDLDAAPLPAGEGSPRTAR